MNNSAVGPVSPLSQLPLHPYVLTADRSKTLDKRCIRIELRVFETGHEAVAPLAHATDLGAVESEIELVLIRLGNACTIRQ